MKLLITGDFAPVRNFEALGKDFAPTAFSERLFGAVKPYLAEADFAIVNLESPLTETRERISKSGPALSASPLAAEVLAAGGFYAAALANNHIFDCGTSGLRDTLRCCQQAGLAAFGAGLTLEEASRPLMLEHDGQRVALLNWAENEFGSATGTRGGGNPLDIVENVRQIRRVKELADRVVVIYHGGCEHHPLPPPEMRERCRFFVEQGADAVICHHSHILSGAENFHGAPIYYSLGNFVFPAYPGAPAFWDEGCMVRLDLPRQGAVTAEPIFCRQRIVDSLPMVEPLPGGTTGGEELRQRFDERSTILLDTGLLNARWEELCAKRYFGIARLLTLGLNKRWLCWLNRCGLLKRILSTEILLAVLNYSRCASLREMWIEVLNDELRRRNRP